MAGRRNARCPKCGSLERHRLLWLYLERETDLLKRPARLLHVAPEPALERRLGGVPGIRSVTVDRHEPAVMVRADLTDLPFVDGFFDVALCSHVLEHVADDRRAIAELHRVLAPGGWAIVQSPVDPRRERTFEDPSIVSPEERLGAFGQHDHLRIYGRDYPERLRAAGFAVTVDPYPRRLGPEAVRRYALEEREAVFRCER